MKKLGWMVGLLALTVEAMVGTGLENREVTGAADSFPASTEQLVGWCRVKGALEPMQISHVWLRNGEEAASVPLAVKSVSYRTYSRVTVAGRAGNWTLEVRDMDGAVLAKKEFDVK